MSMSEDERIAESVRRHGWHAIAVEGTPEAPPFLYSIGLCDTFGHPEIVICGLNEKTGHQLVSDMVTRIRGGQRYHAGEKDQSLLGGYPVVLRSVHPTQRIVRLGFAAAYYRRAGKPDLFSALQLLWSDAQGRLPFEPRCDSEVVFLQPLLEHPVPAAELREFMRRYGGGIN
jgi:hypothetical protein